MYEMVPGCYLLYCLRIVPVSMQMVYQHSHLGQHMRFW